MEINTDYEFQRRVWSAQRAGWVVIAGVIVAGALGLFGKGLLSRTSAEGSGLRLEYERFGRVEHPMRLRFLLSESRPDATIALRRAYLEAFRIEKVTPEPAEVRAEGSWFRFRFAGSGPLTATFDLIPLELGPLAGAAQVGTSDGISFRQFIYP